MCESASQLLVPLKFCAASACIESRWGGGFMLLRALAGSLLPPKDAALLEGLAATILSARSNGKASASLMAIRLSHAELLEAAGDFDGAATLYKQNIGDIKEHPELRLAGNVSDMWCNLAIALHRRNTDGVVFASAAEGVAASQPAYEALEHGLADIEAAKQRPLHGGADLEEQMQHLESQRLYLLDTGLQCATSLHDPSTTTLLAQPMLHHIFAPYVRPHLGGADLRGRMKVSNAGGVWVAEVLSTGRRFALRDSVTSPIRTSRVSHWVEELAAGEPVPHPPRGFDPTQVVSARRTFAAATLPSLPSACAVCGAAGRIMRCGGCKAVSYCSKACQVAGWPSHRDACRPRKG